MARSRTRHVLSKNNNTHSKGPAVAYSTYTCMRTYSIYSDSSLYSIVASDDRMGAACATSPLSRILIY
jgi:hypothetical protein